MKPPARQSRVFAVPLGGILLFAALTGGCQLINPHPATEPEGPCHGDPEEVAQTDVAPLSPAQRRAMTRDYVMSIRAAIARHWFRPAGAVSGARCVVHIEQRRDGCIMDVTVKGCADRPLKGSVEQAVYRSSPLPAAPHPSLFDPKVIINFKVP